MFRLLIAILSTLALAGSALELRLSSPLQTAPSRPDSVCPAYLCDENAVANFAYREQLKNDKASLAKAILVLRGSVARDPGSAQRWADLAQALAWNGSRESAATCLRRSLELGSGSARILLAAGEFELQYGDRQRGLELLRQVVAQTRDFDEAVFSTLGAGSQGLDEALADGLPVDRDAGQAYLRYLLREKDNLRARAVWSWMGNHHLRDEKIAGAYAEFLFAQKRYEEAADVWAAVHAAYHNSEFVFNGDFAQEPGSAPFDWRIEPAEHVEIGRDCEGACALRVSFDGSENLEFRNLAQTLALKPGSYTLHLTWRPDGVTTDQGPRFRIQENATSSHVFGESAMALGTSGWQSNDVAFQVPPATPLVQLQLVRHASLRFDSKIAGSLWIRRVSVTAAK